MERDRDGNNDGNREHIDENRLSADRLIEVAEAALDASKEIAEYTGQGMPYPADLMGTALQPASLAPFTLFEVEQASEFLFRLGEVMPTMRKRSTA
jgi:hypothetical protein